MTGDRNQRLATWFALVVMGIALAVTVYARLRLLSVPLERDEGEYAYLAQRLLQGVPPYLSGYTMKLPGVPLLYSAAFLVAGATVPAIHGLLLLANLGTAGFLFRLARRHYQSVAAGAVAVTVFLVLSLSYTMLGAFARAALIASAPSVRGLGHTSVYRARAAAEFRGPPVVSGAGRCAQARRAAPPGPPFLTRMVETKGLEPSTSGLQSPRSPN